MNFWPFKRKKNIKVANDDATSFNSSVPSNKLTKFALWGSCIGAFILGVSGAIGVGISAWKYTLGSEFGKSYNVRFELDNSTTSGEDPTGNNIFDQHNALTSDQLAQQAADSYSKYLQSQGVDNITVYPEVIHGSAPGDDKIFINATLPNKTYYDAIYDEKTKDVDKTNIFYSNVFSSRLTMVINNRNPAQDLPDGNFANFTVIPLDKFIDKKRVVMDGGVANQVDVHLTKNFDPDTSGDYSNIVHDIFDTTNSADDKNNSQIYIIKNYNELLNYCSFLLQVFNDTSAVNASQRNNLINYFKNNDSGESKFVDDYNKWANTSASSKPTSLLESSGKYNYRQALIDDSGLIAISKSTDISYAWSHSTLPLFINSTYTPASGSDEEKWSDPTTSLTYKFMSKYVVAFGGADKADSDSPSGNSFLNILPKKDPTDKKAKDHWQWLTLKNDSYSNAVSLYNGIKNFDFDLPIKCIAQNTYATSDSNNASFSTANINTVEFNQQLKNDVFGLKPIIGLLLSLCLIIFAIGVIVSLLYRIPGLFGALGIFGTFGFTLMILMLSKYTIIIPMILALLIGVFATTICVLLTCAKIKKHLSTGTSFNIALKKGLRGGLLSMIDIHAVLLLIGISITYFAAIQLTSFGIALLLFSLVSLGLMAIIWLGSTFLLFYNKATMFNTHWFTKKVKVISKQPILFDKEYSTIYSNRFDVKRFSVFGWKQILIASLIAVIAIVGITLIFTVGINGSYVFFGGTRIILPEALYDSNIGYFTGYSEIYHSNGLVYLYFANGFDASHLPLGWTHDFNVGTDWISIQTITSAGIFDYMKHTIYAMLIASGFVAAYSFIRLNWVSVIAVFIGTLTTPLLLVGIIAVCQIYINLYVVLAVVAVYTINALLIINLVDTINNQWLRKRRYLKHELKKVMNIEAKNSLITFGIFYAIIVITLVIFTLFNSTNLSWPLFTIIIGVVVSIPILYGVVPILLYTFILLRYRYATRIVEMQNPMTKHNYDRVDEQLIDGVNKFKRKIIEI